MLKGDGRGAAEAVSNSSVMQEQLTTASPPQQLYSFILHHRGFRCINVSRFLLSVSILLGRFGPAHLPDENSFGAAAPPGGWRLMGTAFFDSGLAGLDGRHTRRFDQR